MSGLAFIKSPDSFTFGDDVELFLARFSSFATATKCVKKNQFDLFKSFLDDRSFRRVGAIVFGDEHRDTAADNCVDMDKEATQTLIKEALAKEAAVPERISLRFKVQGNNEGIEDFGDAIRLLGQKVHGQNAETSQQVIEAFCAGLRNPELASKLLCKEFKTLKAAIAYAVSRKEAFNIKAVISSQEASAWDGRAESLHNLGSEAETSAACAVRETAGGMRSAPPARQGAGGGVDTRVCWGCNRVGHIKRFCDQANASKPNFQGRPGDQPWSA